MIKYIEKYIGYAKKAIARCGLCSSPSDRVVL